MNDNNEFGYKIRQVLNEGLERLDGGVAARLHESRQRALASQRIVIGRFGFAGLGHNFEVSLFPNARTMVAVVALVIGAACSYYWNAFEQARELEEIDSALLIDELPPSAYLDHGFQAWLERNSESSSR